MYGLAKSAQNLMIATLYCPNDLQCMIYCDGWWMIEIMNG